MVVLKEARAFRTIVSYLIQIALPVVDHLIYARFRIILGLVDLLYTIEIVIYITCGEAVGIGHRRQPEIVVVGIG